MTGESEREGGSGGWERQTDRDRERGRRGDRATRWDGETDRQVNIDSFYRRCLSLEGTRCKRPRIAPRAKDTQTAQGFAPPVAPRVRQQGEAS